MLNKYCKNIAKMLKKVDSYLQKSYVIPHDLYSAPVWRAHGKTATWYEHTDYAKLTKTSNFKTIKLS